MDQVVSIEFPGLGITIENMGKNISIFGFEIAYYGIIIAFGIMAGVVIACWEAKATGQKMEDYIDFALYVIIASIVGARLYYVIFRWDHYKDDLLEIFNLRHGGLAIYGAIIAAVLTCLIYTRVRKLSFPRILDTACLGLIAGQIIGRWGNFFNREAFGSVTSNSNPLAMRIYFDSYFSGADVPPAVKTQMEQVFGNTASNLGYIQVHPTFLYESLWNLCVLILILIFRRKKAYDGEVFLWYVLGYAAGRAWIEGLRTDQLLIPGTTLPVSQILSIAVGIAAICILAYKRIKIHNMIQTGKQEDYNEQERTDGAD